MRMQYGKLRPALTPVLGGALLLACAAGTAGLSKGTIASIASPAAIIEPAGSPAERTELAILLEWHAQALRPW